MVRGPQIPVACTLDASDMGARLQEWRRLADRADGAPVESADGVELHFAPGAVAIAEVASLVAAEIDCCAFFTFRMEVDAEGLTLSVSAPPEARGIVAEMLATDPASASTPPTGGDPAANAPG